MSLNSSISNIPVSHDIDNSQNKSWIDANKMIPRSNSKVNID